MLLDWLFPAFVGALVSAVFTHLLGNFALLNRITKLETDNISLRNKFYGEKGNSKREENIQNEESAMAELMAIVGGQGTNDEKMQKAQMLALKYPQITAKYIKELARKR